MKMLRKIVRTSTIFLLWMTFINMPAADGASISTNNGNTEGINETESVISNFLQQYGEEIREEELKEEITDEQLTKLGDEEEEDEQQQQQQQQKQQQQEANESSHVNVEVTQTENQVTEEKEETIEEELRETEDDKAIISLHTEEKENEEIDEKQGFEILEEESLENLGLLENDDVEVKERKSYDPDTVLEVAEGSECKGDDCDDNDFEGDQLVSEGRSADENIDVSLEGETSEYYEDEESLEDDEFGGHSDDFGETHDLRLGDYEIAPGYAAHLGRKNGHRSRLQIRAWPDATIPYVAIVSDETNLKVEKAMQHIRNRTCLNFRERTTEERYLHIKEDDGGCWTSSLGYPNRSKKVIVGLGRGCRSVTGVIHEVLHAAGFLHEHSRPDRDDFIEIEWGNILKNRRSQFRRDNRYSFINIPYDYKSVMHYGRKAFAVDQSKPTIVARRPLKVNLGGYRLSDRDVKRINAFYNC